MLPEFEVISHDGLARRGRLGDVETPALMIQRNSKMLITDGRRELVLDGLDVVFLPDLIPAFSDETVRKVLEREAERILRELGKEIVALSVPYFPNPSVFEPLSRLEPRLVMLRNFHIATIRRLIDVVTYLRDRVLPWDSVLVMASIISEELIPFLPYLGVDVVDVSGAQLKLRVGKRLALTHFTPDTAADDLSDESSLVEFFVRQFRRVRALIKRGELRHYVEAWAHASQQADAFLTVLDLEYGERFIPYVSLGSPRVNVFITSLSFTRPVVEWYRRRLAERYVPPEVKVVIVLPCAARKPYSLSRSHRLFKQAIASGVGMLGYLVHEVMITSPIGVVPRELERTWPCAHYDTTTTGHWSDWEKKHVAEMLADYFRKARKRPVVILHVDGGYLEAALTYFEGSGIEYYVTGTVGGDVRSSESLRALSEKLREVLTGESFSRDSYERRRRQEVWNILSFQWGREVADAVLKRDVEVTGSVVRGDLRLPGLFTLDPDLGLFVPEREGARILAELRAHVIEVNTKDVGDYLRAEHVRDCTPDVESGNYAVCVYGEEPICAVRVLFPARALKRMRRGVVARVVRRYR